LQKSVAACTKAVRLFYPFPWFAALL
jgi:hypothetical protein